MAKHIIDADRLKQTIADNVYPVQDAFNSRDYGMFWTGGIEKAIDEQPAVDVAPRWIPVTESLPEERGTYLVTVNDGGIGVAIAQWWYNYLDHAEGYFVCDDCYAEDIVAWMPLPEPYKESEQNG